MAMKFAISYSTPFYGVDPDKIIAYAQHAENHGFESLYLPEHIVLYPGAMVGAAELPTTLPYADPLDCLSFVAAATHRILLGTGVLLLPYHHPVVLAKRLATINVLSKGRMRLLTVGLGTLPGEASAVGVDFSTRGRRADEAIDVLRLLWAGGKDGVSFRGEFFAFDNLCSLPKPYGVTHLPIHIGGSSRAAAIEAGRSPETLEYTRWGSIDMSVEQVEAFAAQGVTRIVVSATTTEPDQQREQMSAFAQRFGLLDQLPTSSDAADAAPAAGVSTPAAGSRRRRLLAVVGQVDECPGGAEVLATPELPDRLDTEGLLEMRRGAITDPGERGDRGIDEVGQAHVLVLPVHQLDEVGGNRHECSLRTGRSGTVPDTAGIFPHWADG
jgi:alkanesulfonate monooxygenase SsuD/methylene tetrahydromethanopterin reductase-like flavin-dependent oxidoreductase (luciferase family)